jgi:phosphomannomutase
MRINPAIFKQYDVRGIYPEEIDEKAAYQIGGSFVNFLGLPHKAKIVVGRDLRKSSKPLAENFIKGLMDAGADVIDTGTVTSPMLYFAKFALKTDAGAMITASHNPLKYNGIKMLGKSSSPINGEEIKKAVIEKNFQKAKIKGNYAKVNISKRYFDKIIGDFKLSKKIKISIDSEGGAAKLFIPEFVKRLNLLESKKPDFFASFDYDADRLMISDKNKKAIRGDIIGAILADAAAKKGDIVIYDLRCSRAVPRYLKNKGIKAMPSKVGRYDVIKMMKQTGAVLGIEVTGHYYFKKLDFSTDPFFALRKILEQIDKTKLKISDLIKPFGTYHNTPIIDIKIKDFEKISEILKEKYRNASVSDMDGLTFEFSNWWFNIRLSNTEPLIRLAIEANTPELLEEKKKELLKIATEK